HRCVIAGQRRYRDAAVTDRAAQHDRRIEQDRHHGTTDEKLGQVHDGKGFAERVRLPAPCGLAALAAAPLAPGAAGLPPPSRAPLAPGATGLPPPSRARSKTAESGRRFCRPSRTTSSPPRTPVTAASSPRDSRILTGRSTARSFPPRRRSVRARFE